MADTYDQSSAKVLAETESLRTFLAALTTKIDALDAAIAALDARVTALEGA